mgnify:CR=1 FL=1
MTRDELAEIKIWWHLQTPETQRDVMRIMTRDYEHDTSGMSIWEFIYEFDTIWRRHRRSMTNTLIDRKYSRERL